MSKNNFIFFIPVVYGLTGLFRNKKKQLILPVSLSINKRLISCQNDAARKVFCKS